MTREPIRTLDQAVAFLLGLVRDDPRPYQDRARLPELPVRPLLARVGDPQDTLCVVHIAGSKGKGSTALYLEAMLQRAGLGTGTFTSPHLQRWTERLRVHGRESTDAEFCRVIARLAPHVRELQAENDAGAPSFFDVLTAAALMLFAERHVDCAILEAGIGGRLDATNVVAPALTCITSVELEHTDKLGDTIEAIAREKAGIIKKGVPVVVGMLPPSADAVIRARAAEQRAPVEPVRVPVGDGCRALNAAIAAACARRVAAGRKGLADAVADAIAATHLPGRMEIVARHPWVVIDGAHTRSSAEALAHMLEGLPARRRHLLVSLSGAKDAATVLAPLLERADSVVVTSADPMRSADSRGVAAELVARGYPTAHIRAIGDPREAIARSRGALADDDLLCIAGSMYLAGLARGALLVGQA